MTTRKNYPKEFKLDAISLVLEQEYTRQLKRQTQTAGPDTRNWDYIEAVELNPQKPTIEAVKNAV